MSIEPKVEVNCNGDEDQGFSFSITVHNAAELDAEIRERQAAEARAFEIYLDQVASRLPVIPVGYHPVYKDIPEEYAERWEWVRTRPFQTLASANVIVVGNGRLLNHDIAVEYVRMLGGHPRLYMTRIVDFYVRLDESFHIASEDDSIAKRQAESSTIVCLDEQGFLDLIERSIAENSSAVGEDGFIPTPNFFLSLDERMTPYEYDSLVRSDEEIWQAVVERQERTQKSWREGQTYGSNGEIATPKQLGFLYDNNVPLREGLTFIDASRLIDDVIVRKCFEEEKRFNDYIRGLTPEQRTLAVEREKRRKAKLDRRKISRAKEHNKEKVRRKEAARRCACADVVAADRSEHERLKTVFKERRKQATPDVLHQWREELTALWNNVLADGVVEVQEAETLRDWLLCHMRRFKDFTSMFALLDDVLSDGVITSDETQRLYDATVECLKDLGSTHYDDSLGEE